MNKNSIVIPAFVICLEREADRRKCIKDHLNSFKVAFDFFNAVDGRTLSVDEKEKYYSESLSVKTRGRILASGEIGCYLSHSRIWQHIVDAGINKALVIESDAVFTDEAIQIINKIDKDVSGWELIMLYYRECYPAFKGRFNITPQTQLVKFSNKSACTTAYLVTSDGAKKLLDKAYPIQMPVDDYMTGGYIDKQLSTFAAYPRTVHITDDALETSSIREDLFPMMDSLGIKRRVSRKTNIFKILEKELRRFFKKLNPPSWL
ncbi:MAG: glycosyltransferase family 25 protein [Candidatus Endonucleobacter bathymodioli]|uniref:Glycosyltransferase family 25 protein n=1 Tax=Candidatus Endonucleibacter bathymodioli TaxID=539814 RepID=A0AA90SDQ0_9GAMM|nr:glycosyltransferase family 25 protein [Candidatus Endonucleobacter bathymodioli]